MVAKAKAAEEAEESTEPEPDKASLKETIIEVLHDLGLGEGSSSTEEESTSSDEEIEEIESPRQQESRMRKEVESAIGALHIHVDSGEKEQKAVKETETVPGKKPFLQRFIGLDA